MDLKTIKVIIDLMRKNSLSEFELEKEGFKIKLRRGASGAPAVVPSPEWVAAAPATLPAAAAPAKVPEPRAPEEEPIKSPMIGTFYLAPAPDAAAYVDVGTEVVPESVVCIIEAMKVMNEIKAEVKGTITEITAEDGKPVEFGQSLFKVRPA